MLTKLIPFMQRPQIDEEGTTKLWDDEHILKGMLASHLNPDEDGATRKHAFVRESVQWIARIAPVELHRTLLDLGCGPGIYAEAFHAAGYQVAGMDFSRRSINYARNSAQEKDLTITYHLCDYLTLDFAEQFALITLINYDFGVLAKQNRANLLRRIHSALTPGGLLVMDAFTPRQYADGREEYKHWEYAENGFFCAQPHLLLKSFYSYEPQNAYCAQYIVITEHELKCFNVWEHCFTKCALERELNAAGFTIQALYGSIAGAAYRGDGIEMCVIAQKKER